jgi:hypothetical protein
MNEDISTVNAGDKDRHHKKKRPLSYYLDATPRPMLFYFAVVILLIASALSGVGFVLNSPPYLLSGTAVWIIWLVVMFMVVLPGTDRLLRRHMGGLKRGALIIFSVLFVVGLLEVAAMTFLFSYFEPKEGETSDFSQVMDGLNRVFAYNDSTALTQQGAENLLDGKNPYAHANIVEGLLKYNGAYDRVTPLQAGRFADVFPYPTPDQLKELWEESVQNPSQVPPELESRLCYPAGSFLLPAPFLAMGIKDIRIIYAIFALAGLLYAAWRVQKRRRLIFLGAAVICLELWNGLAGGETCSLCFPLILVGWLALDRNLWLSAVFMGLAVASKQTAWFLLPFYLILLLRTQDEKRLLGVLAIMAGIFAAFNLPFIARDPGLWLASVASPMTDPMFPVGIGFISLVTSGVWNIQTSLPFAIMELVAMVIAILWYYRNCRRYPHSGLILATVPLFFAWRSLWTYFFYVDIIALAAIMASEDTGDVAIGDVGATVR